MATLSELLEQKSALERQIREAQSSQKSEAVAQIRKLMADNGLTPADLAAGLPTRKSGKGADSVVRRPVAAKYKHPESGATWSGRGLKPKWLSEELARGKTLGEFAI